MRTANSHNTTSNPRFSRVFYYMLAASFSFISLYITSKLNYPLMHIGIELASVVIGCSVFLIVWNSRRHVNDTYFLIVGVSYLFIAVIDVLHTMAYKGVDIFASNGSNLPTQLWLAARYLQAVSFLIAPMVIGKRINAKKLFAVYTLASIALMAIVFLGYFPTAFTEDSGLTLFKKLSEYLISLGFVGAAILLNHKRHLFDQRVFKLLTMAIYVTIASELSFTLYADPFGLLNLIGHFLKAVAFYLVYRAIIKTALINPIALLYSNLRNSEAAIRASEERLARIIETNVDGIAIIDSNRMVVFANQAAKDLLSISDDDIGSKSYFDQGITIAIKAGEASTIENPIEHVLSTGTPAFGINLLLTKPDGSIITISENAAPLHDDNGKTIGTVVSMRDITEQKINEEKLNYLAFYDSLTGLPNRSLLGDRMEMVIARALRNNSSLAVIYIDLDNFKIVNDTVGHTVGDGLIVSASKRLKKCLRKSDTIARISGDEFVLVLPDIAKRQDIAIIADEIIKTMNDPFILDDHEFHISASMGISVFPEDGSDAPTLLKNADSALYSAKAQGKDIYSFYAANMNENALQRLSLENDLRRALGRKELVLYYQPLVDFATNEIIGMEALIRWQHHKLGLIPPVEFIYIAEETGLINPIGDWVLREACRQNKAWQNAGFKSIRISVNVSACQFHRNDLITQVKQALDMSGLEAGFLEIEITESTLMQDKATATKILEELRSMGVHISLDDFGTGYSSLSYLKSFPIGKLKIDQAFIRTLLNDPNDAAIVSSIITMAQNLKLRAVAEGVETEGQFDMLNSLNCSEMQGYLFSRPLPGLEASQLLADQQNPKSKSA